MTPAGDDDMSTLDAIFVYIAGSILLGIVVAWALGR